MDDNTSIAVFECKCCGHCCHGVKTVSVSKKEQERIAKFLGIGLEELKEGFLVTEGVSTSMKVVDGHCIFYGKDGLCSIHPVKPFHCKRWPLHPSILSDEAAWLAIKSDCPGFKEDATWDEAKRIVEEWMNES